ncbi:hypothetical protein COHA_005250 [Chlorella ohadii]|uniref:Iron-sulfur cluster biosynthesis family n=1 Tax=Chlorella ohadii TaxID=2649997 RepID=A0AAD5DN07_9CHLO|nr:hypothetical protein COHA_005250 [Chlorella ohadii]
MQSISRPALRLAVGGAVRLPSSAAAHRPRRLLARRATPVCLAAQRGAVELLLDKVPGEGQVLSAKLSPDVRQRAERAIKARGGRVTVGDVASTAGLRLDEAEGALRALAADSQATLQVASDGEIVWVFPSGFEATIASKSWRLRAEPAFKAAKAGLEYLVRVAFGTALIASVCAVYIAIMAIASGGSDRDDRRRGGGGGYYGGPRVYFDLTDLLWYWDPFYYRNRRQRMLEQQQERQGGMNFLEAIFSFVFGDGDPNEDFDRKRWQAIGRYIQSRGGTVVAEELAPFLDLQPSQLAADRGSRVTVDESYVLPVLARFNGRPEVDDAGQIQYVFPDLQQTATAARRPSPPAPAAMEQRWQLTAATAGQQLGAIGLGAVNLVGVAALTFMLQNPVNQLALARNGLLGIIGLMPFLQAYAAAFFALPLFRSLRNAGRNADIDRRNSTRQEALRLLANPDPLLRQKLAAAQAAARQNVITNRDVIYRSDRPLASQPTDLEADSFEARLQARERERQQAAGQRPPPATAAPQQQQQPPGNRAGEDDSPLWWRQQQDEQRRRRQQ